MNMLELYPKLLFAGLVATSASGIGLLSVWAGDGRGHWFVRLPAVGAVLALGTLIPAYDLILLFFTQAAVVVLTLFMVRGISGRRDRQTPGDPESGVAMLKPRFAVADLLLAVAVACGIFAVSGNVPRKVWEISPRLAVLGMSLGAVTLAAAWVALGRVRLLIRLPVAGLVAAAASSVWNRVLGNVQPFYPDYGVQLDFDHAWWLVLIAMAAAGVMIAVHLLLAKTSRRAAGRQGAAGLSTGSLFVLRLAKLILAAMIVLPPAYTLYRLVTPPPVADAPLPRRIAYEEETKRFISQWQNSRPEVTIKTLSRFNALSDDWEIDGGARLAVYRGEVAQAARSYLNCIYLGHSRARGGRAAGLLLGIWCEGVGTRQLPNLQRNLSQSERHRLAENLAEIEATREAVEPVLRRERTWVHSTLGWQGRLHAMIGDITGAQGEYETLMETLYLSNRTVIRLLICDIGVGMYQLENGKPPRGLSQLVPDYLPSVPEDPFGGGPLVYRLQGDGHVLYSIGPNRRDDGGRRDIFEGDILLDMDVVTGLTHPRLRPRRVPAWLQGRAF